MHGGAHLVIRAAAESYVRAFAARRDAKRLLDIGFAAATKDHAKVLRRAPRTLAEAIEIVAVKEACDRLDIYDRDPGGEPDGRTADVAFAVSLKVARSRYARGKCWLCKGPALRCARRHAHGRSCA